MIVESREYMEVPVERIDLEDKTFLISYPPGDENLRRSIAGLGILNPLSLRRRDDGRFQVIAGFKRLRICKELGIKTVPSLVYPAELQSLTAFKMAINDNISRNYNLIEKANILHKLIDNFNSSHEETIETWMPLLGLHRSGELLRDHLLLQGLTDDMRQYVCETGMPLLCAARIASYLKGEQDSMLEFLRSMRPGFSKLREILTNAEEIATRDGKDISSLFSSKEMKSVMSSNMPRPNKLEQARSILRKIRYPTVTDVEALVDESLKSLRLPQGITIRLPPYLEGDVVKCELKFKSVEDLKRLSEKLNDISEREELKKIFDLL